MGLEKMIMSTDLETPSGHPHVIGGEVISYRRRGDFDTGDDKKKKKKPGLEPVT